MRLRRCGFVGVPSWVRPGGRARARGVDLTECPGQSPAGRRPACASGACVFLRHFGPVIWSIDQDWRWEAFFAYDCPARCARRIRLVAYGARLESVLGASPRGFESPILRHQTPGPVEVPGFLLPVAPRVVGAVWPDLMGRAAVCAGGRRPAREPSAPRASLGASARSPARPRHRPPALRPGPPSQWRPSYWRRLWCCVHWPGHAALAAKPRGSVAASNRAVTALLSPGLVPLDSEAFDDLCARERGQDLARHKELRSAQA